MENKFKVGDRVVLATNLEIGKEYNGITLTEGMVRAFHDKGAIVEIVSDSTPFRDSNNEHYCVVYDNDYAYGVDMLELVPNLLNDILDREITCVVNVSSVGQAMILYDIFYGKLSTNVSLNFIQAFNGKVGVSKYENGMAFSFYEGKPHGFCDKEYFEHHEDEYGKIYNFEDLYTEKENVKMNKYKRIKELKKQIEEINAEIDKLEQERDDTLEEYEHGIYRGYDGYVLNDCDCFVKDYHPSFNAHDYNPYRHYITKEYGNKAFRMKRFNDMLMAFKWCYDREYKPDWAVVEGKYYICYDYDANIKCYRVGCWYERNLNIIHFSSEAIAQKCADWLNTIDPDGKLVV